VPYWRPIDEGGLHIGYRKGENGGRWVGRRYVGKRAGRAPYDSRTLPGCADDTAPADGVRVLDYAQAIKAVRAWAAPAPAAGPLTVKQACADYVAFLKAERKTGPDAEQRLARHVLPKLGDKLVTDLTAENIEFVKRAMIRRDPDDPEVERRSKDTANRILTSLKAALNRAFAEPKNGIASDAAWRRVKPFHNVGRPREVFLDAGQANRLVNVTSGAFCKLVTAALLTGARPPHELATARVRDFHRDLGTLTVDGKTGRRDVVLTKEAVRFFVGISVGRAPDDLLLPKDDGTAWGKSHHVRSMQAAVAKAKLPEDTTIYSLRHSHASQALLNGMNLQLLAENMGTSVAMIEKHYGKFLAASRRQLVEETGFKLGLRPGNVAPLR
jgi:integrase